MQTAIAKKKIIGTNPAASYPRKIDLGNGVMYPVTDESGAGFIEWMIKEAKAGRVTLPNAAPGTYSMPVWPDSDPKMTHEEFLAFYENR